jgi:vacuolar protein sorting-associated protein 54
MRTKQLRQLWDVCSSFTSKSHALLEYPSQQLHSPSLISVGVVGSQVLSSPVLEECMTHAHAALQFMHERNLAALAAILDAEQWRQADVPTQVQSLADAMAASSGLHTCVSNVVGVASAAAVSAQSVLVAAAAAADVALIAVRSEDVPLCSTPGSEPRLIIRKRAYHVVGAGVMLIKMLGDYSGLGEAIPIPQVSSKVIAATVQLLREFNVRTTRLVLNAGALRSAAALKRITAKHLAVTLQTIGALLALLPSIRGSLVMRLPPGEAALPEELSRVTADLMQHEQRLLSQVCARV